MRTLAPVLCVLWLLAYGAPSWVLLRFELDRDRIVREECVQRGVPLEERTCFGQCHLVAELNDLKDKEAGQGAPQLASKWEPEAPAKDDHSEFLSNESVAPNMAPMRAEGLLSGHPRVAEGVPWSVA
ncbi:MAG: hypothetical protein JNL05_15835 [Flavobacteriales bacterium]|nr:hypothetical protein [Flavobacteriales bacterium]